MKFHQILVGAAILFTGCSSPKYVYQFDQYDYNSGKKIEVINSRTVKENPLVLKSETLIASSTDEPAVIEDKTRGSSSKLIRDAKEYTSMSKTDRREVRKLIKKEIKNYVRVNKVRMKDNGASVGATKAFDTTVALALVFGVAGIILTVLASTSNVFWVLGAISIVIGCFFFVRWVSNGNG